MKYYKLVVNYLTNIRPMYKSSFFILTLFSLEKQKGKKPPPVIFPGE